MISTGILAVVFAGLSKKSSVSFTRSPEPFTVVQDGLCQRAGDLGGIEVKVVGSTISSHL